MPVRKKLLIVLTVVVAGASLAFLFRKDAAALRFWERGQDDPFARPVERRVTVDAAWAHRGTRPTSQGKRVPAAATAAISEPAGLGASGQPSFRKNLNPVGALLPPIEGVVEEQDELDSPDGPIGETAFGTEKASLRHVVVDGDTLSSLAERYLGRADAYLQIYELNRDVLASPDLLPIGAALKIPPRMTSGKASTPRGEAHRNPSLAPGWPTKLVPVSGKPG